MFSYFYTSTLNFCLPLMEPAFSLAVFLKFNPVLDVEEEEEEMCSADPSRFVTDAEFGYQEFTRREEDHFQVFRVQVGAENLHWVSPTKHNIEPRVTKGQNSYRPPLLRLSAQHYS